MKRREVIHRLSLGLGVSISVPTLMLTLESCNNATSDGESLTTFLNPSQSALVKDLAEMILPATDTPGAGDLKLHLFVDKMIDAIYDQGGKDKIMRGSADFEDRCRALYDKDFSQCTDIQKKEFLLNQEKQSPPIRASVWGNPVGPKYEPDFYRQIKSLLLLGYFSSEEIGRHLLHYDPVPGKFESCIDLPTGQKIDAL